MKNNYKLSINDLRVWVHLGVEHEEKHHPQLVSIDIEINFNQPPLAIKTDQLADTFCYVKAVESIQALTKTKRFNLIESLCAEIHDTVCSTIAAGNHNLYKINVVIKKMSPPVPGVHGYVAFSCNG